MTPALARYMAIDYGEKRVGLAISDPIGMIASPAGFIARRAGKRPPVAELVRRAEAGDEVILTRHGHAAVRLVPVTTRPSSKDRKSLLEAVRASGAAKVSAGPSAARSQDFLYGEDGLPE